MPSRTDRHRPFPSRPRFRRRVPLLLVAVAVALAACSQRSSPPDGARVSAAPPVSSPSPAEHPPAAANGTLVFSRAHPTGVDGSPAWSVLRTLRPDGSTGPTVVERAGYRAAPSWSPDGGSFAYLGEGGIRIWRARSSSLLVPCHPASCSGLGPPAWSPSGRSIVFGGERDGVAGILQVPSRGGDLTLMAPVEIVGAPSWSPDGSALAVVGADGGVIVVDATTGDVQRVVDFADLEPGAAVAWSPDGSTLAVEIQGAGKGHHEGIYLSGADGSDPRLLTACPDDACTDLAPAFSPDGRWVVFTRARCDEPGSDCFVGDVWVVSARGGTAHALTQGPDLDCCAAWQPRVRTP